MDGRSSPVPHGKSRGLPLWGALFLLFLPSVAYSDAVDRSIWQDLASELDSPDVVLGLAADIGVIFASHFWVLLEDAWIALSLIAVLMGGVGYAAGFFRGREQVVHRMFAVMVVITVGMQPMAHSSYTAEGGNSNPQALKNDISQSLVGGDGDANQVAQDVSTAPILIEIPTRVFMGFHLLFGSAVYDTFGAGYLDSKDGVAFSAINVLNDNTPARVLGRANGDLANLWRVYQGSCSKLAYNDDTEGAFTDGAARLLGFESAGMLINPIATNENQDSSGIPQRAKSVMEAHVPYIHPRTESDAEPSTSGDVVDSYSSSKPHPEVYATYQIPSAHYWLEELGGKVDENRNGVKFLTPPGGRGEAGGNDPDLSYTRFRDPETGELPHDLFVGLDETSMDNGELAKHWVPMNCWEYYQTTQMGFNHYYAGYGGALISNSTNSGEQACAAEGLKAILNRFQSSGSGTQGRAPVVESTKDEERSYRIMNQWFPESECDHEPAYNAQQIQSFNDPVGSGQLSSSMIANLGDRVFMRVQNQLSENNDGTTPDGTAKEFFSGINDAVSTFKNTFGGLMEYLNLSRNVPLIKGFVALVYAMTIMAFPFIIAFAVMPGRADLLFLPLKILLYCHVLLFTLYFVFQAAGWASAALVAVLVSTQNTTTLMTGTYADLLAALPLLVHVIVGIVIWLCWKLIFGGFERGVGGSAALQADQTGQQKGGQTTQAVVGAASSVNRTGGNIARATAGDGTGKGAMGMMRSGGALGIAVGAARAGLGAASSGNQESGEDNQSNLSGSNPAGEGAPGGNGSQNAGDGAQKHAGSQSPAKGSYSQSALRSKMGKGRDE